MTKEEFIELSSDAQEHFIESGGKISVAVPPPEEAEGFIHSSPFPSLSSGESMVGGVVSSSPERTDAGSPQKGYDFSPVSDPSTLSKTPLPPPRKGESYNEGFDIENPVELLFMLDENIQRGSANNGVDLHPWQIKFMLDFAEGGLNDKNPFQSVVRACNGSGKDKYIIAPCVVWLCMKFKKAIGVVTSSSGAQLDNQTCRYIKQLCEALNVKIGHEIWNTKYRHYQCDFGTGKGDISEIFCYATDEAGKAEGYHPTDFGAKMGIFVSEDKTVPDEINVALNKCTGYTHRVHVSTPGLPLGHFFNYCATAIGRELLKSIKDAESTQWIQYHVTAYDCSHISKNYIEQMKRDLPGGELGSAFRSQVLAEFGSIDAEVVIPYHHIWTLKRAMANGEIPWRKEEVNKGGLDLARGGDELVFTVRNGNKCLTQVPFRFDDTEDSVEFLIELFKKWKLTSPEAHIFVDCGGLGAPIYDRLKGLGWSNLKYVVNQAKARDKRIYRNRGAEMWWNLAKLIERKEIIILDEHLLITQLTGRYYKKMAGEQHQLESKQEAKSKGRPSPDRADSLVLCFSDYTPSGYVEPTEEELPFAREKGYQVTGDFTLKAMSKAKDKNAGLPTARIRFEDFDELRSEFNRNRIREMV